MSDKYYQCPDNMPVSGDADNSDAPGQKLLKDPGQSGPRYNSDSSNSCDDKPGSGDSDAILDPSHTIK